MPKLSQLETELGEIATRTTKAFGEIRTKIDALNKSIADLTAQLSDAEIPAAAANQLELLKVLAGQLDDIVPDAPTA